MNKKQSCIRLRGSGYSFRDISKKLNIPLSTVFLWSKNVVLSKKQKQKIFNKSINILQTSRKKAQKIKKKKYAELCRYYQKKGKKVISSNLSKRDVYCICSALYWAEGFKKDNRLGFANSDPKMVNLFLFWLTDYFKIPKNKIRLRVVINSRFKADIKRIEQIWSIKTGIPLNQFHKASFQKSKTKKTYPNQHKYIGVLRIRAIGQNKIFRQILGSVSQLQTFSNNLVS